MRGVDDETAVTARAFGEGQRHLRGRRRPPADGDSDRLSAFDVVMAEPIPNKGRVLTAMTAFWFELFDGMVGSHCSRPTSPTCRPRCAATPTSPAGSCSAGAPRCCRSSASCAATSPGRRGRSTRRAARCTGRRCPPASSSRRACRSRSSRRRPRPPSAITTRTSRSRRPSTWWPRARDAAPRRQPRALHPRRRLGRRARHHHRRHQVRARPHPAGELVLCDEVLTPDSSRFWPVAQWKPGTTPPSFDKQPVRDYLETLDWNKTPPPPPLPQAVVDATSTRYVEAYERITGRRFADWPGVRLLLAKRGDLSPRSIRGTEPHSPAQFDFGPVRSALRADPPMASVPEVDSGTSRARPRAARAKIRVSDQAARSQLRPRPADGARRRRPCPGHRRDSRS